MNAHPFNLALRFLLELAALGAMGFWGWQHGGGILRVALALGIPLLAATLWAVFRVPGDPGNAPVTVPGLIRLLLELAFFGVAVWVLYDAGAVKLSWGLGIIVIIHYLISYDRILWIIKQ